MSNGAVRRTRVGMESGGAAADRKGDASAVRERHGVQSIEVGGRILSVLAAASGPTALSDIAKRSGMSASKAHRYLVSLLKCGLVRQDKISSRYDLGDTALRLGLAALSRQNVVKLATEAIIELNQQLDITVCLSVWAERGPTVVGWYDGSEIIICNVHVGSVFPLLRTASGRVFLAYLPRSVTQPLVRKELGGLASQVPQSRLRTMKDVENLIVKIRQRRLGITEEEFLPGLSAVGAPIFDYQGKIVAVIAILGVRGRVDVIKPDSAAIRLRDVADSVSRKLGFTECDVGGTLVEWIESDGQRMPAGKDASPPPALRAAPVDAAAVGAPLKRRSRRPKGAG